MARMPPTLVHREQVFLCHASPRDDAAFWLDYVAADGRVCASPIEAIEAGAEGINAQVILCGHTHIPRVVPTGKRLCLTWSKLAHPTRAMQFWSIPEGDGPPRSGTYPTTTRPWLH
jgi:hypothetical protein